MNRRIETIVSDDQKQFDGLVNDFLSKVLNPTVTFHSSPVVRSGNYNEVSELFIAHITYIDFLDNIE